MMNSINSREVATIIEEIFELLDPDHLHRTIDRSFEEAVDSFEFDSKAPMTFQNFFNIIADFVAHISRFGPIVKKMLSPIQARSKALSIIEKCYRHLPEDIRLDTAYLDAAEAGIKYVLEQMANHIKETARQIHTEWVFRTRLKSLNWQDQCSITKAFINREKPFISSDLLACHPDQLTQDLEDLMKLFVEANSKLPK